MKLTLLPVILGLLVGAVGPAQAENAPAASSAGSTVKLLRDTTYMMLKEGNIRFVSGKPQHPNQSAERRAITAAEGQEPLATVLACSDSREPVELIFDRGVGELFVVRVAGNVADTDEIATIEYGVAHLNTPILIVMGHTRCGAVSAVAKGVELHGYLPKLAEKIKPAVEKVRASATSTDELVALSIPANVWQSVSEVLQRSDLVRQKVKAGLLQVVGAVYDLDSGVVSWLGTHPDQSALLESSLPSAASATEVGSDHSPAPAGLVKTKDPGAVIVLHEFSAEKKH